MNLDSKLGRQDRTGRNRKLQELQRIMKLINSGLEKTDDNVLKCDTVESHSELSLSEGLCQLRRHFQRRMSLAQNHSRFLLFVCTQPVLRFHSFASQIMNYLLNSSIILYGRQVKICENPFYYTVRKISI